MTVTKRRRQARSASGLDAQLLALQEAVEVADGRLDAEIVDRARRVIDQAGARLGLGMDATVVALAGPTGSGKSTLFNALAEGELARPGHLRPTTSTSTAAIWGEVGEELLDWLEVPSRHRREGEPHGLVLLDLPDFDSVQRSHREEAERIVQIADLTIWVVDPQKYADATLHERYLRPFAEHGGSMLVVLNQVDRLDEAARAACLHDMRRLLAEDGLSGVPVLAAAGLTGFGLDELRHELRRRVEAREAAARRLTADVIAAAEPMAASCAGEAPDRVRPAERAALVTALSVAAGVPTVVHATAKAHRRRGALATGWPYVRWLRRFRPDPLRRLRVESGSQTERSSLGAPTHAQRAQVDAAIRSMAGRVGGELPEPWPGLARAAALSSEDALPAHLDAAITGAELPTRRSAWWGAVNALQWLLVAASIVGALWLFVLAGLAYLQLDSIVPTAEVEGLPVPTTLMLGGAVLGMLLAALAGLLTRVGARRRARRTERILRERVTAVAERDVLAPLEQELAARRTLCAAVQSAGSTRSAR